jgi:hypothetical protein
MLSFLKKIFGAKPVESAPAPYKVENTVSQVAEFPFPTAKPIKSTKKTTGKKPAVKKTIVKKSKE